MNRFWENIAKITVSDTTSQKMMQTIKGYDFNLIKFTARNWQKVKGGNSGKA